MHSPIQTFLAELHGELAGTCRGGLATYIPELTKADPEWFGICLVTMDGVAYSVGDIDRMFTMQSISKPFVYATALADRGPQFLIRKVGVEPSGDAFNSISLDPQTGAPLNPMINAGAIATTSLVAGETTEAQWRRIESSIVGIRRAGRPRRRVGLPVGERDRLSQSRDRVDAEELRHHRRRAHGARWRTTSGSARFSSVARTWPTWRRRSPTAACTR